MNVRTGPAEPLSWMAGPVGEAFRFADTGDRFARASAGAALLSPSASGVVHLLPEVFGHGFEDVPTHD